MAVFIHSGATSATRQASSLSPGSRAQSLEVTIFTWEDVNTIGF